MRLRSIVSAVASIVISFPAFAAITGTVINADGQPVAGAKISVFAPETTDARRLRVLSKTPVRTPLATATSDSRGNFSIESPKEPVLDLRFEAAGFAPEAERVLPDEELGAIAMFPAAMQSGTITAGGKPVAGAQVLLRGSAELDATTDEKGHYSAPDPSKWADRMIIVHPDFAIDEENLGPFAAGIKKGLDRTLEPGGVVSGHVFAADGTTPIDKATIFLDGWRVATSGADGAFKIAHAPKNWSNVEARLDDRIGARTHANGDLSIKLVKAATVTGIVSDAKTNQPLAGVEVRLLQGAPGMGAMAARASAFTNAKGSYTLEPVIPGTYQINPTRPGYVTPNVNVSVTAGQVAQKSLYSTARGRIAGNVIDEQKHAVAGARVGARAAAGDAGMIMLGRAARNMTGQDTGSYTAPDGRFVLRSVATDADIQVDASKKGFPAGHSASLKLAPAEKKSGVTITIPRGIALTGKVTDRDGRPLSGVAVEPVEARNDGGLGNVRRMVMNMMQADRNDESVRTASDGTYTMRVKEGTYDVIFKREGLSSKTVRGEQVNAAAKPLNVTMEPGVEITGRVTRSGVGVEGVNVIAMGGEGQVNTVTAADGSFRLEDLTPGPMSLIANKRDDFIQEMRPVTAPAQNVVIDVRAGGKISGHVVDKSSHKPVSSFQAGISMSRSGGGMMIQTPPILKSFTNDDGSFTLENVPPGAMQVVVSAPGYTTAHVPGVNVEENKPVDDLQVELDAGVKLAGRVTGPDGSPLSGVSVRQDVAGPGRMFGMGGDGATITDPNGEYSLDALEAGEKTFTFSRQGYLAESRTVTLSGSSSRLDVQLSTGVRLTGTVVTDAGAPVADATVGASSASESGFGGRQARTDASGGFEIDGLAPGHYQLYASKTGFTNGILRDFDVASGIPARIVMKSGGMITGHVTGLTPQELENATVFANGSNGYANAPVDANGNYKVEGAPTGTVRVMARTGQMFGAVGKSSAQKSVQVDPGGSVTVDIEFKTDTVIRGRVTRDGQAMANAAIAFFPRGGGSSTNASSTTDSSGNYEVSGLEDGTYNVQIVDFQRTAPFTTTHDVKGSGTFDIDIKSASLRGRVTDATTGEPLTNARVELHASSGDAILSNRVAATDSSGAFVIDNIARGNYEVKADREGYGHDIKNVIVGDTPEDVEFKLSPSSGVTITVVDARDNRTLSANVFRVADAQGRVVDTSGMYRFGGTPEPVKLTLSPGTYTVTLGAMGYAVQTVSVVSPSNPTVRLTPGGTLMIRSKANTMLRARLIDANGAAYVRGYGPAAGIFTIDPSPGVTTLQNIAAGSYTLQILGIGDQVTKQVPVTVTDGIATPVEVE